MTAAIPLLSPIGDVAVVSGGAGDIGTEIALVLSTLGCHVAVLDIDEERVTELNARSKTEDLSITAYLGDLAEADEVKRLRTLVLHEHGPVSIVANAVGIVSAKKFLDIGVDEWNRVMKVNLQAVFSVCQAFVPSMYDLGCGRVINIASAAGKTGGGLIGTAAYSASKAGVIGLTKALARELAPHQVTCNAIAPGPIHTRMTNIYKEQPELRSRVEQSLPLRRIGEPVEVADVIGFLATKESGYITGETFDVDGGLVME